jgi:DNA-binding transcriptional LysR family regulator
VAAKRPAAGEGASRVRERIEMGSNETIKQAVMAGLGIAFISAHTVAAEIDSGRLVSLAVEGLPMWRQWFVVRRADKAMLPAASAFAQFLRIEGSSYLPSYPAARPLSPPGRGRPQRSGGHVKGAKRGSR